MRGRSSEDAGVALLVAGAVVVLVLLRKGPAVVEKWKVGAEARGVLNAPWVPWLVLALVVAAAVVAVVRFVVTKRTLSSRVRMCVLPTETFDPSDQSVRFFSRQLPGVPRLVRGWMDPRAGAVRVRMAAAGQGRMMYSWEAPERSRSALQAAAGAYDEIELRPAETFEAAAGAVASSGLDSGGDEGEGDAVVRPDDRERGDSADELDLDEAEALGELVELAAPFWAGDPGPEDEGR